MVQHCHFLANFSFFCLRLLLALGGLLATSNFANAVPQPSHPRLVRTVHLGNVSLTRKVEFTENTTLAEDIQLLDQMFAAEQLTISQGEEKVVEKTDKKAQEEVKEESSQQSRRSRRRADTARARLLLVGDHSLFEKFLRLYGDDEYAAFNGLYLYLDGVFGQLQSIFGRLLFFDRLSLHLELAGPPMVVLRAQDCPLRAPLLAALQQRQLLAFAGPAEGNFSSSAVLPPPSNSSQPVEEVEEEQIRWDRLDALLAVQWTSRWIRRQQLEALMPEHEHLLLVTALDLLSQLNDSSTQGMAYVRAMCRRSDSVSVVEDVGGLGTATVAAHELAHSLGAFHDGSGDSENCTGRQNFLMAPISAAHPFDVLFGDTFSNAFQISACTRSQIEGFLNSSDSHCLWEEVEGDDKAASPLLSASAAGSGGHGPPGSAARAGHATMDDDNVEEDWPVTAEQDHLPVGADGHWEAGSRRRPGTRPGQQFHPGRQCQIAFGPSYGLCQRRDFLLLSADPCRRLWCKDRRQRRWAPCETKGFLPMMDGTRCGEAKWCLQGQCRPRTRYGRRAGDLIGMELEADDKSAEYCSDLNRFFCQSFGDGQLSVFCPVATFSRLCCASCRPFRGRRAKAKASSFGKLGST